MRFMMGGFALDPLARARGAAADDAAIPRFAFISHAPTTDEWWNSVKNALQHAAADFGVAVDYLNPADGRISEMARLIERVSPQRYAGVISTIADFQALRRPLSDIVNAKHLPLITVNSGTQAQSEQIGALMHIGQPEFQAGLEAGQLAAKAGAHNFLCLNHYANNPASHERCKGFAEGLGAGVQPIELALDGPPDAISKAVASALEQHPDVQALLALGPLSAHAALQALKAGAAHRGGAAPILVSFDLSAPITQGIKAGTVAFAIDQQPYLQGYLPVALLAEYVRSPNGTSMNLVKVKVYANEKLHARMARYGLDLKPARGQHINSGPGFVTRINIEKVERFSGQYR
jgi:simple sugar transport system substrate-binding protein